MEILIFTVEEQQYGMPLSKIQSVILAAAPTEIHEGPEYFIGVLNIHGSITLVIDFRKLLGLPTKEMELNDKLIVCRIQEKPIALWIDQVEYIKHCQEKNLIAAEQILPDIRNLQYVLKEEDRFVFLYDLERMVSFKVEF